ncbi:hypothetical protein C2845_PM08G22780 [Panicum miliaceum]|uniref:Uncharacterized protein n=1 Tax=Panicum miliaceum TaxID=4540 RepID=A0A3L6R2A6_PANMI|nr:hypothetical protein C2845_PM08G22780 [Panicum miliaceum]
MVLQRTSRMRKRYDREETVPHVAPPRGGSRRNLLPRAPPPTSPAPPSRRRPSGRKKGGGGASPPLSLLSSPRPLLVAGPSIAAAAVRGNPRPDPPREQPDLRPRPPDLLSQGLDAAAAAPTAAGTRHGTAAAAPAACTWQGRRDARDAAKRPVGRGWGAAVSGAWLGRSQAAGGVRLRAAGARRRRRHPLPGPPVGHGCDSSRGRGASAAGAHGARQGRVGSSTHAGVRGWLGPASRRRRPARPAIPVTAGGAARYPGSAASVFRGGHGLLRRRRC